MNGLILFLYVCKLLDKKGRKKKEIPLCFESVRKVYDNCVFVYVGGAYVEG